MQPSVPCRESHNGGLGPGPLSSSISSPVSDFTVSYPKCDLPSLGQTGGSLNPYSLHPNSQTLQNLEGV